MCEDCGSEHREMASPAQIARVREIESRMPGERVPESAWAIFFGHSGGPLAWAHHHRMLLSCATADEMVDADPVEAE